MLWPLGYDIIDVIWHDCFLIYMYGLLGSNIE